MRAFVKDQNRQKAQVYTLALGLGEEFPGIQLLKSLAEDNNGKYTYVDLARQ